MATRRSNCGPPRAEAAVAITRARSVRPSPQEWITSSSQFSWDDRPAAETAEEYIAFEFSPDVVADMADVIRTLERNHRMRWWPGKLEGVPLLMNWFPSRGAKPQGDPGAEEAYATMRKVDETLTPQARKSWRWRQLYLRALLDSELKTNGGSPNELCNEAFAELIEIYHAENAIGTVRPPLPKGWKPSKGRIRHVRSSHASNGPALMDSVSTAGPASPEMGRLLARFPERSTRLSCSNPGITPNFMKRKRIIDVGRRCPIMATVAGVGARRSTSVRPPATQRHTLTRHSLKASLAAILLVATSQGASAFNALHSFDFNTAGNTENWLPNNTSFSISGGTASGTASRKRTDTNTTR